MKTQTSSALSDTAAHNSRDPEQEKKGSESPPVKKSVRADDGLNLVCEVRGQGDTALVFLHGWGGDREYWKHQVGVFAADYRVVALDQAGHSESGKGRKAWTADSLAGDVETVVKALGLKRVILVGHSMAGWVALLAAERMPGTVVAVIGVDTLQNAEFKLSEEVRKSIFDGVEKDFKRAVRTMFDGQFPEKADPEVKKWVQTKAAGQDPKMAIALMRDLFSLDTGKLLKEAKVPVRCINSAGGYKSFTPTVVEINKKYADFGAVTIDGVGHYPMLEKPDEFNHKLRDVLKEFATKKGNKENTMRRSYWFLGHHQTILAGAADTEGRYDFAEGRFPAGTQIPPHVHRRYSEHFYVLEGELTVWAGLRKVVLRPGDDLLILPGTAHAFHVTGNGPWRALAVASPSGFARLVSEVGTPDDGSGVPPSAPTNMDLLKRVSAEVGDEILGPPGVPARVTNLSCAGVRSAASLSMEEEMASTTGSGREMPVSGQSGAKAPARYQGFDGQYIDGSWRPGKHGGVQVDTDPYSGATLAEIVMANQSDLDKAYHAAAKAQVSWAARLPAERAAVMLRSASIMEARHGEIVDWLIREAGSTRVKAELEWQFVHAVTLEAASFPHRMEGRILPLDEAGKESRAYRQPLGVIGVISPWNFPMYLSHRSIAPALALGNAVAVKPAGETPVTGGLLIAKIYEEAGLPSGLLNVVVGPSSEIGDPFTTHPIPRLISFTGSTPVGRRIGVLAMQAPQLKRVALELGGNAPLVVLDDADLEHAVRSAVVGRFLHQGQVCMSTNRIIVDASIYNEFVDRFTAHVKTLKYGDPNDPSVSIGPVINEKQLRGHLACIERAKKQGARELLGGVPDRQVLPPHVFAGVTNDMAIAQDEIFGPIAPIIKVKDEEEALQVANQTEYGLSSAVFTRDRERGVRFALQVEAGMTHVNDHSVDDTPTGPFGGEKNSGLGRFGGEWILHEFTRDHWVTVRHSNGPYPF